LLDARQSFAKCEARVKMLFYNLKGSKMADKKTIKRDGIEYWLDSVKTANKNVGFAPTKVRLLLADLQTDLTNEQITSLANRQLRTDAKNLVRPKFSKDKR